MSRPRLITVYTSVTRHHDKKVTVELLTELLYGKLGFRWKVSHINLRTRHDFRFSFKFIETLTDFEINLFQRKGRENGTRRSERNTIRTRWYIAYHYPIGHVKFLNICTSTPTRHL